MIALSNRTQANLAAMATSMAAEELGLTYVTNMVSTDKSCKTIYIMVYQDSAGHIYIASTPEKLRDRYNKYHQQPLVMVGQGDHKNMPTIYCQPGGWKAAISRFIKNIKAWFIADAKD